MKAFAPVVLLPVLLFGVVFFHEGISRTFLLLDRRCSINNCIAFQTSNTPSSEASAASAENEDEATLFWNNLIKSAEEANYSCIEGASPTTINATISANGDIIVSSSVLNEEAKGGSSRDSRFFIPMDITFRAYDENYQPQKIGGDVFVVDFASYWPSSAENEEIGNSTSRLYTAVKSSAFTRDNLNGTYTAKLSVPRKIDHEQVVQLSLRHYYTCHDGLKLVNQLKKGNFHRLEFGPFDWPKASKEIWKVMPLIEDGEIVDSSVSSDRCESSINEDLLNGVWVWEDQKDVNKLTSEARWTPINCKLDDLHHYQLSKKSSTGARPAVHFRIGDSTMPGRVVQSFNVSSASQSKSTLKVKIGIPYMPYVIPPHKIYLQHHEQFINVLQSQLVDYSNKSFYLAHNDTFVYGGGLHHTFHANFNVRATATLLLQTICQLGLTFPGQIYLRGPNPIQQHLYPSVDQTSLHVRRLNWELLSRLKNSNYRLSDLCIRNAKSSTVVAEDVATFVFLADTDGNILLREEANPILLQRYNYSWERDSSFDEKQLSNWMRSLTIDERKQRYGNRVVGWLNFEHIYLSRYETYRENDKIHSRMMAEDVEGVLLNIIEENILL